MLIFQGKESRIYTTAPAASLYFLYGCDRKHESWVLADFGFLLFITIPLGTNLGLE